MVHKTLCLFSTHSSPLRNFSHVLKQQFLHINQSNLGKVPTPDLHNQLNGFADSYTYSAKNTKWILKSIIFFLSGFRNSQQNVKVLPTMSLSCITSVTWSKRRTSKFTAIEKQHKGVHLCCNTITVTWKNQDWNAGKRSKF